MTNHTQTGSIDLTATNGVHLYAKAGFETAAETYATQADLEVQADRIGMVVANQDASSSLQLTANAMTYIGNHVEIKDSAGTSTVISGGKVAANSISASELTVGVNNDIDDAAKTATNYITEVSGGGIKVHDVNDSTDYAQITSDGMDVYNDGENVARFGSDGAQIGKSGAAHSVIDANGQRFYATNGTTQLANIGYGDGTNVTGGVSAAPYFLLGQKPIANAYSTTKNYEFSDICRNNDKYYCCIGDTSGAWDSSKWVEFSKAGTRGNLSLTEGYSSSPGYTAHSEGNRTIADGFASHAEGAGTLALGDQSHAEGSSTAAFGIYSHAEGADTVAKGLASHAQNRGTIAASTHQTAIGRYNVEDTHTTYALIVGNGTSDNARNNAFTLDWSGSGEFSGDVDATAYNGSKTASDGVLASSNNQTAIGKYNVEDTNDEYALIIGNGTDDSNRSNALTVTWSGNIITQAMAGIIQMFAGATAPDGWLNCDGSAVSRTTYATLFAAIGTTWGAGDGSTTFNVPDLRGRAPIGSGTGSGLSARTLGDNGGAESVTLTAAQSGLPAHTHSISRTTNVAVSDSGHTHGSGDDGSFLVNPETVARRTVASGSGATNQLYSAGATSRKAATASGKATLSVTQPVFAVGAVTGGEAAASSAHTNMQPFAVVSFIICTGKTS